MLTQFISKRFLSNMEDVLKENEIFECKELDKRTNFKIKTPIYLEGFGYQNYIYLFEAVNERLKKQGISLTSDICIPLLTKNRDREYYFLITKEENKYYLFGTTPKSVDYFINNFIRGPKGVIKGFDTKNKETLESDFSAGKLSFENNYPLLLDGIKILQNRIEQDKENLIDGCRQNLPGLPRAFFSAFFLMNEESYGSSYTKFDYSSFIVDVYSFLEHVAVLTTPFWFALKDTLPQWSNFCSVFHNADFDTFKDFWTNGRNWIDSFIYSICHWNDKYNSFSKDASMDAKDLKFLYDRIRHEYRNPIHHGMSTSEKWTGLSMEVPSLKNRVILNALPLSKDVNSKAYEDTKVLLDLFLKVFRTENGEILKYLESGLNVPVDCTELKAYVLSGTVDEFIEQYNELLNHHDEIVEMQK